MEYKLRTTAEIMEECNEGKDNVYDTIINNQKIILEVLLDIRRSLRS